MTTDFRGLTDAIAMQVLTRLKDGPKEREWSAYILEPNYLQAHRQHNPARSDVPAWQSKIKAATRAEALEKLLPELQAEKHKWAGKYVSVYIGDPNEPSLKPGRLEAFQVEVATGKRRPKAGVVQSSLFNNPPPAPPSTKPKDYDFYGAGKPAAQSKPDSDLTQAEFNAKYGLKPPPAGAPKGEPPKTNVFGSPYIPKKPSVSHNIDDYGAWGGQGGFVPAPPGPLDCHWQGVGKDRVCVNPLHTTEAPTLQATWGDPTAIAAWSKNAPTPKVLNGIPLTHWTPPEGWKSLTGMNQFPEPPPPASFQLPPEKDRYGRWLPPAMSHMSAGVIMQEPDGRFWVVEPKHNYGGVENTFPKGTVEKDMTLQATAIKEGWEESGLKATLVGYLGDYKGETSTTRYYIAKRSSGVPTDFGEETMHVKLVPPDKLRGMLNKSRDKLIFDDLVKQGYIPPQYAYVPPPAATDEGGKSGNPYHTPKGSPTGGEFTTGPHKQPDEGETKKAADRFVGLMLKAFDSAKHPHVGKGTPKGGEFAAKPGKVKPLSTPSPVPVIVTLNDIRSVYDSMPRLRELENNPTRHIAEDDELEALRFNMQMAMERAMPALHSALVSMQGEIPGRIQAEHVRKNTEVEKQLIDLNRKLLSRMAESETFSAVPFAKKMIVFDNIVNQMHQDFPLLRHVVWEGLRATPDKDITDELEDQADDLAAGIYQLRQEPRVAAAVGNVPEALQPEVETWTPKQATVLYYGTIKQRLAGLKRGGLKPSVPLENPEHGRKQPLPAAVYLTTDKAIALQQAKLQRDALWHSGKTWKHGDDDRVLLKVIVPAGTVLQRVPLEGNDTEYHLDAVPADWLQGHLVYQYNPKKVSTTIVEEKAMKESRSPLSAADRFVELVYKAFDSSKHPHAPKGAPTGGEFVATTHGQGAPAGSEYFAANLKNDLAQQVLKAYTDKYGFDKLPEVAKMHAGVVKVDAATPGALATPSSQVLEAINYRSLYRLGRMAFEGLTPDKDKAAPEAVARAKLVAAAIGMTKTPKPSVPSGPSPLAKASLGQWLDVPAGKPLPPKESLVKHSAPKPNFPPAQPKGAPVGDYPLPASPEHPPAQIAALTSALVSATGIPLPMMREALAQQATVSHNDRAKTRSIIEGAILTGKLAIPDAIQQYFGQGYHDSSLLNDYIGAVSHGPDKQRALKEYADTPLYDMQLVGDVRVENSPVQGQAVCFPATRSLMMGATSVTGDFRHELGHAVHAIYGGKGASSNPMSAVIHQAYKDAVAKAKADPTGYGESGDKSKKMTHEWYETHYGIIGRRGLDDDGENFAEFFRGYNKYAYQDRKGETQGALAGFAQRFPEMNALFDAHYTAALLGAMARKGVW